MADETVTRNLQRMDELDFAGWNEANWEGVFTRYHTDDVLVEVHGQASTHGIRAHIEAMKAFVESTGGVPVQVRSHPIGFGSGDWTCVVGELENGSRMVTLARWETTPSPRSTSGCSGQRLTVCGPSANTDRYDLSAPMFCYGLCLMQVCDAGTSTKARDSDTETIWRESGLFARRPKGVLICR